MKRSPTQALSVFNLSSPLGNLRLSVGDKGLYALEFRKDRVSDSVEPPSPARRRILELAAAELADYFAGKLKVFTVPLDLSGATAFTRKAWNALLEIPWGETRSYGWQAGRAGNPAASRAVGGANGRNRIPIIVPCHRVVTGNGKIGGYSAGPGIKEFLLDLEGSLPRLAGRA